MARPKKKPAPTKRPTSGAAYQRQKAAAAERSRDVARAGRDIGTIPPPANPARRRKAEQSLRLFCETYLAHKFSLAWSPDHLQVLTRMEEAIRHGGLFALAMARGSGKTSICEAACLWAILNGLHQFLALIGASAEHAHEMLESIKGELEHNDLLAEDFPEVCFPIRALEGIANRCKGQLHQGRRTHVAWRKREVVLPTIGGSKASGAVLRVAGITGRVRGMKFARPDGRNVRPTLCILDDPQTDQSAASVSQCAKRERVIAGAVLGLAGPGEKITAICPCTVIRKGDVADNLLDRQKHPLWTGQRYKLLNRMPDETGLWEEYAVRRADEFRNGGDGKLATAWYGQRKERMDRGALVAWPERFQADELSAVQHAMNLYFADKHAFAAEYQNEPLTADLGEGQLEAEALAGRTNGLGRGLVPLWATHLTAFIDVQQRLLYWAVCAWADDFTGALVDHGTWPDQARAYFTAADAQRTLGRATAGAGVEGAVRAGLQGCVDLLVGRQWKREDAAALPVERLLIDSGWQTDTVFGFARQLPPGQKAIVLPSKGLGIGARSMPLSEYPRREGERIGLNWILRPADASRRAARNVLIDANWWKTFLCARLHQAVGDRGAFTLFGRPGQADHRMLADHLASEYWEETQGRGRKLHEWAMRPGRTENHWWDCLVGCAAGASMQGCALVAGEGQAVMDKKRVSFRELQARQRAG
jgi:Terminase large subunit gpA, endonuclease domain